MDLTPAHQLAATRMFLTKEDVDDIANLVVMCQKEQPVVVDLGAGTGNTALTVFLANPNSKVVTVDNHVDNLNWAEKNLEGFGVLVENWKTIHDTADGAAEYFLDALHLVDIWLHDADHSENQLRIDIRAWWYKFTEGTLIWVHDYLPMAGSEETYPGVKIVCDELVKQGLLEQIPTTGIGFAARVL